MIHPQGHAAIERTYDETCRVSWFRYTDTAGQPVKMKGIVEAGQAYDAAGNLVCESATTETETGF